MRKLAPVFLSLAGASAISALVAGRASAASFLGDGTFAFDTDADAVLDFEQDLILEEGMPSLTIEDEGALEGTRVLALGAFQGADVPIELPPRAAHYRASAWVRGEAIIDVEVTYGDNPHAGVDEIGVLYPTGRMTSDGWVEVANSHLRIDAARSPSVSVGFFAPTGAAVDAFEIVALEDLGPSERSGDACQGTADPVCGAEQTCAFSQCRYVGGLVPDIPLEREAVTSYLEARLNLLFGPLHNRALDLPNANSAIDRMSTAPDPWSYWNGFTLAVRRLHDGHTTTSGIDGFVLENEKPLGLCFIEGDADLSHHIAPQDSFYLDVLVSHTSGSRNLELHAGDRIVMVDGQHPIAWARAQVEHHWYMSPTSNHATFAELAEQLRGLVARYAHSISVIRCDPQTLLCGQLETIDLSALPCIAPDEVFESVQCDNRPLRHLADSPANHSAASFDTVYHGLLNESDAVERIYGAEWESLYTTTGTDFAGAGLNAAVAQFEANAAGVILDHRSGNGGTIVAPGILWSFAVPRRPVSVYLDRQRFEDEEPDLAAGLLQFQLGVDAGIADYAGSNSPTTMPVALLLTRDVSASDWLPLGFQGAADNVKIFAPFQTNGGFSTRYGFGYWFGVSYVIAVGDTFDASGQTRNGRGVEPDFVVLPRQSDLLAGKDSVFDAALAWVRQELGQ